MKPVVFLQRWLAMAGLAVVLAAVAALSVRAQDNGRVTGDGTAADETVVSRRPLQDINEVIAIGGDTVVRKDQMADEVVVVRGNALIEGEVDGDVVVVLGRVTVTGRVRGDVVVVLGEAEINGEITRDLSLILTRGRLGSEANVRGTLTAVGAAPEQAPGAVVRGRPEIVSLGPIMEYVEGAREYLFQGILMLRPFPPRLGWVWVAAGVFLLFHVVLALALAGPLRGCMDSLREQPARSFLVGLLACVLIGPISILLSFTVVATPLLWLAYWALCIFGRMAVYASAGAALGRASGAAALAQPVPALIAGSLLFYLSYMIPVVGFLAYWLVLPWGIGAVLIRLFEALRKERQVPPGSLTGTPAAYGPLAAASGLAAGTAGPVTQAMVGTASAGTVSGNEGVDAGVPVAEDRAGTGTVPGAAMELGGSGAGGAGPGGDAAATGATPTDAGEGSVPPQFGRPRTPPPMVALGADDLTMLPRVAFWPRFGASAIDLVVVGFLNAITFGEVRSFWLLLGLYHFVMWMWKGTTLGGSILGLRLIRLDGRRLDWQTCAVRLLGSVVSLLPLGLGFFWASWDEASQSWHDRIAGTTVVKADRRAALV